MFYSDVALFQSVRLADGHCDADSLLTVGCYIKCCLLGRKTFWQRDIGYLQWSGAVVLDGDSLSYCHVASAIDNQFAAYQFQSIGIIDSKRSIVGCDMNISVDFIAGIVLDVSVG